MYRYMYTRIYIPVLNSITSVGMSTKDHNLNNKSQRPRKTHKANNRQGQSSHSTFSDPDTCLLKDAHSVNIQ